MSKVFDKKIEIEPAPKKIEIEPAPKNSKPLIAKKLLIRVGAKERDLVVPKVSKLKSFAYQTNALEEVTKSEFDVAFVTYKEARRRNASRKSVPGAKKEHVAGPN